MDATHSTVSTWVLAGIAWLLLRVIGRVEDLEKKVDELLGRKKGEKDEGDGGAS
jgi:hypothetical protein